MTFFPEPLRPSEGRQDDDIVVNPIEADKKSKERELEWDTPEEEKRPPVFAAVLVFMKKLSTLFTRNRGEDLERFTQDELTKDVQTLRNLLNQLKELDQSKNAQFCQEFSELWHRLLQHIQVANRTKRKTYVDINKLKGLITDIEHFPPNEDHKLGYYLVEYAGEAWLPVLFREILKHLYSDHKVNQDVSVLEKWTNVIKDLLES